MNTRLLKVALAVLISGIAFGAVLELGFRPGLITVRIACDRDPNYDPEECARADANVEFLERFAIPLSAVIGGGAMLLFAALALEEPLPGWARGKAVPQVSWQWRGKDYPPRTRIAILAVPITAVSVISFNLFVIAVSVAAFLVPLVVWRHQLRPGLVHRSFLLSLGIAAHLVGFVYGGAVGLLCVSLLGLTVLSVLFVSIRKL